MTLGLTSPSLTLFTEEDEELSVSSIKILFAVALAATWAGVAFPTARIWIRYFRNRNQYHLTWAYATLMATVIASLLLWAGLTVIIFY